MSDASVTGPPAAATARRAWPLRFVAGLGGETRRRTRFVLILASLALGVVSAAPRPRSWRRTVRFEFRRALRQAIARGMSTLLTAAALIGALMVYQALYWLGAAGEEGLIGSILVTALVREITPVLVGLIVLGRSGMVTLSEIGRLQIGGQVYALEAQGIELFQLLVLPRACAFAIATFALGIVFVVTALVTGFVVGSLLEVVHITIWTFFDRVLLAMHARDFVVFPAKLIAIGLLVALTTCLTALTARPSEDIASLLPRGFMRGVLVILFTSLALSLLA